MAAAATSACCAVGSSESGVVAAWSPPLAALWEQYAALWLDPELPSPETTSAGTFPAVALARKLRFDALVKDGTVSDRASKEGWRMSSVYGEVAVEAAWDIMATASQLWRQPNAKDVPMANTSVRSGSSSGRELPVAPLAVCDRTDRTIGAELSRIPGKFVDLGSGAGRVVMCMALTQLFESYEGIELDDRLHQCACASVTAMAEISAATVPTEAAVSAGTGDSRVPFPAEWSPGASTWPAHFGSVRLRCGDLTTTDWRDAAAVFVTATCFSEALLGQLTRKCTILKPGSVIVAMGRKLDSPLLEFCGSRTMTMSWGKGTMHVYRRARGGKWLAGVLGKRR